MNPPTKLVNSVTVLVNPANKQVNLACKLARKLFNQTN